MPRIVTYNVRRCVGADGQAAPGRIAEAIAQCEPEIVALQELDVQRARTGGVDQAHAVAMHLRMSFHFHPAFAVADEQYGDAVLTALPMRLVKAGPLPGLPRREPRGALWVAVTVDGQELQLINTHLGLGRRERLAQAEALLGPAWLGHADCRDPVILLGDFNTVPQSASYRMLSGRLRDAQRVSPGHRPQPTFPARLPMLRIDHMFVSGSVEVLRAGVAHGPLARMASDHLPLFVDFRLAGGAEGA